MDEGAWPTVVCPPHSLSIESSTPKCVGRLLAISIKVQMLLVHNITIDSSYVDGVSLTHGQTPRKHIWTFAAAHDEIRANYVVTIVCG